MGSNCCQMQSKGVNELQSQQKVKLKKKSEHKNKISIQSSTEQGNLDLSDLNKENSKQQQSSQNQIILIDEKGGEYKKLEGQSLEMQELTGDLDRVDSICITENGVKDSPMIRNSIDLLSIGSKKAILKKETKYSHFRKKADYKISQKKVRFIYV